MSGLCGWFCRGASSLASPAAIGDMAAALNRFDGSAVRSASSNGGSIAVAAPEPDADVFQGDPNLVAVWGCARFADSTLAALAQRHGIARALSEEYGRKQTGVLSALSGTFAIAIFDSHSGEAVLATDRMGTHPLYYCVSGDTLVFGSTLDAINAFPAIRTAINRQAIYDYVYFHTVPGPQTIYTDRQRLLPGTFLHWRSRSTNIHSYWEMKYAEDDRQPFSELRETFLLLLRNSIRETADGQVGTFLSGGTDSSTIAGMLGEVTGQPARTYSIGFEAQGYDEMRYARIAARHFGTRHHEYYVTPDDVVSVIPRIAAVHDQPFGNSSAVPTYYCAKLAKDDGVDRLLGGDGGDELFGGNERYAKQYLYSLYSDLPLALRKALIEPVLGLLPSVSLLGKVQRYARNASMPMPARYDNYNLLERFGPAMVFAAQFLDGVDHTLPPAQMAQAYNSTKADSLINHMLALDLKYTLADNDLPKVVRSCELARVEARFPMLDDGLVAFSARLPPDLKLKRTQLRFFFKCALRGFLPDEIIAKPKHGFGLPFGSWLQEHGGVRQIALDSLSDLKQRHIVRPEFIDDLTSLHVPSHARYYGTMVWVLMMLEQWLKLHGTPA